MIPSRNYNLLALSDLHLGCDLKPDAPFGDARRAGLDRALVRFLNHYGARRDGGRPWRLLLAGDIFDFVAVTALPAPLLTPQFDICAEEKLSGLAAGEEKSVWKMRRIAARHEEVFHALARFLAAGNEVHFLRGNHDAELHFPAVQQELLRLLARRAGVEGTALAALEGRIQFHPWFYLEPGLLYAEHGNAHDRYCLQSGFFDEAPASAELELPISSKVLRLFAARWAKEQDDVDGADAMNAFQYIAWIFRMGNPLRIALDFFALIIRLLSPIARSTLSIPRRGQRKARQAASAALQAVRLARVHEWLARFSWVNNDVRPGQLLGVASRPAEQSLFAAAQLFYVDRMILLTACAAASLAALFLTHGLARPILGGLVCVFFAVSNRWLAGRRRCDAHRLLLAAARHVGSIFEVRYVVMGHSHHRVHEPISPRTRYLNLGSWTPHQEGLPFLSLIGEDASLGAFEAAAQD